MHRNRHVDNHDISPRARSRAGVYTLATFSIALLMVATGTGGAAEATANTAASTAFSAQPVKPLPRIWRASPPSIE